ncbi:VOC family protein [Aeromicrobium duanguangcaii]|uniref:VOC family protein n=1 Tax=Aeromicrobium duanguangcaii TaxID=2968086 RepID=UPI0020172D64|nr:VOC family protein [Aeromicrobium duanguangcaii]MCL3837422.1 VOC family protein [Aeromicrobium duanguangcaii]
MAHGDITHIDIPTSDHRQAQDFYGALFGWKFVEHPGFEGYPMWQAPNEISGGGFAPRSPGFTQPRSYVEVDSIDDTLATARDRGARVVMERQPISDTSWWAVIEDPDGNVVGLYEGVTDVSD